MDETRRIEDLYEVAPVAIELRGGYYDGKRILIGRDRHSWLMPPPPPDPAEWLTRIEEPSAAICDKTLLYRWHGSVGDDGTRVFEFTR